MLFELQKLHPFYFYTDFMNPFAGSGWGIRSSPNLHYLFRIFLVLQFDQKLGLFYCRDFIIHMAMCEAISSWPLTKES